MGLFVNHAEEHKFRIQGGAIFLLIVSLVMALCLLGLIWIDIKASVVPIEPYLGNVVAWLLSIVYGSTGQMVLMAHVVDVPKQRRNNEWWLTVVLLVLSYVYDVGTNVTYFYDLGMEQNPRWSTMGDAIVWSVGFLLAFSEYFLGLAVTLALSKAKVLTLRVPSIPPAVAQYLRPPGRQRGGDSNIPVARGLSE